MWCNSKSSRLSSVAKNKHVRGTVFGHRASDFRDFLSLIQWDQSCPWSPGCFTRFVLSLCYPAPSDFSTVDKSVGLPPLHRPLLLGLSHVVPWTTSQLIRRRPVFRDPCWARILFLPWLPPLTTCLDLPHLVLGCFWILHYDSSFGLLVP